MQKISLKGKRVLVTGAAGFIGANLVLRLLQGNEVSRVVGIDNLNDYYDPAIKDWRLSGIRAAAEQAEGYDPEKLPIYDVDDFEEAVKKAASLAKSGDVVILSPASAAFDKFKNFMVRGAFFKKIVNELQ